MQAMEFIAQLKQVVSRHFSSIFIKNIISIWLIIKGSCFDVFDERYRNQCGSYSFEKWYYFDHHQRVCKMLWFGKCTDNIHSRNIYSHKESCYQMCQNPKLHWVTSESHPVATPTITRTTDRYLFTRTTVTSLTIARSVSRITGTITTATPKPGLLRSTTALTTPLSSKGLEM